MSFDTEQGFRLLISAIDRQTEALQNAVRGDDGLSIEERALLTLTRNPGSITSPAELAREMGLSASIFYAKNERNDKIRGMISVLNGGNIRKGFQTTNGIEAAQ